jgi:hypothetical protein
MSQNSPFLTTCAFADEKVCVLLDAVNYDISVVKYDSFIKKKNHGTNRMSSAYGLHIRPRPVVSAASRLIYTEATLGMSVFSLQ